MRLPMRGPSALAVLIRMKRALHCMRDYDGRSYGGDRGYPAYQAVQYSYGGGGAGAGGSYAARVHAMAARTAYGSEREAYGEYAEYETPKGGGGGGGRRYSESHGRGYEQEQGEVYRENGYRQRGGERYEHDARRRWT